MRNWLGQNIEVGSVVGRGARNGNTSDFKMGVVTKVSPDKGKVSVDWRYRYSMAWNHVDTGKVHTDGWNKGRPIYDSEAWGWIPNPTDSKGSPSIESLFLLSQNDLDRCDRIAELLAEKADRKDGVPMTKTEFEQRMEQLTA